MGLISYFTNLWNPQQQIQKAEAQTTQQESLPQQPQALNINKVTIPPSVSGIIKQKTINDKLGQYSLDPNVATSDKFSVYRGDITNIIHDRVRQAVGDEVLAKKLGNSLVSIAKGESQLDPKAQRINLDKSIDTGIFQINSNAAKDLQKRYNLPAYDKNDYNSNINYALANYADGGRERWSYYKNNKADYQKKMQGLEDLTPSESQKLRNLLKERIKS